MIRTIALLYIFSLLLNASHVNWYGDFDKAHKKALKQNKSLIVLLIEENCDSSREVIKKTFINQPYIDKINKDFVSVIVTKNQKASYPIEMLYTFTYPTLFFLDNRELFLCEPMRGGISPENLKKYLKLCN